MHIPRRKTKRNTEGAAAGGKGKLTLRQRYEICMAVRENSAKKAALARSYGVSKAAISKIMKNEEDTIRDFHKGINPDSRRARKLDPNMAQLDARLVDFVERARREDPPAVVTMAMVFTEARLIARELGMRSTRQVCKDGELCLSEEVPWEPSNGWFMRFKTRNMINLKSLGESLAIDAPTLGDGMPGELSLAVTGTPLSLPPQVPSDMSLAPSSPRPLLHDLPPVLLVSDAPQEVMGHCMPPLDVKVEDHDDAMDMAGEER
eukprot:jgi/Mesvir1/16529/Mv10075-RA.1